MTFSRAAKGTMSSSEARATTSTTLASVMGRTRSRIRRWSAKEILSISFQVSRCNSLTFNHDQATQALTIQVGGGADSITLLGFDPNTFRYVVNALRFSDGSSVALADQLQLPSGLIEGTDEHDVIRTGSSDDTIIAGAGNDAG